MDYNTRITQRRRLLDWLKKQSIKTLVSTVLASTALSASVQVAAASSAPEPAAAPDSELVLAADVEWGPLNPARGDKGPRAGTLWGARTGAGPSGFLVQFAEGFSSPPHIHNVSYRGIVINGLVHNDDPGAANMPLATGSFWTQPAGETHITSADGSHNLAYIEIEQGPYLVLPTAEAFDNGERPVNVDTSNIMWLAASSINWINQPDVPATTNGPSVAFLWGSTQDHQMNGTMLKLPAGFTGEIRSAGASFRSVIIMGRPYYRAQDEAEAQALEPGSYFGSNGSAEHELSCESAGGCIIYIRSEGRYDVSSN